MPERLATRRRRSTGAVQKLQRMSTTQNASTAQRTRPIAPSAMAPIWKYASLIGMKAPMNTVRKTMTASHVRRAYPFGSKIRRGSRATPPGVIPSIESPLLLMSPEPSRFHVDRVHPTRTSWTVDWLPPEVSLSWDTLSQSDLALSDFTLTASAPRLLMRSTGIPMTLRLRPPRPWGGPSGVRLSKQLLMLGLRCRCTTTESKPSASWHLRLARA
mmetsp:Transcript_41830/g.118267  ORF Transcript_41830/g.118267 Transcript_41830/m.118267 type:complete len:215 (-) Transcript_41830:449-1093(-)